jgi:citrate synthase
MTTAITAPRGLKNVVVADTELGDVRGDEGFFHYRDRDATVLARTRSFEDVWHFMLFGTLPTPEQSTAFARRVGELRSIPGTVVDLLRSTVTAGTDPLRALRIAVSAMGLDDRPMLDVTAADRTESALRYAAAFPTILAAAHRLARGLDVLDPDPAAGHAADYLRMATGAWPPAPKIRTTWPRCRPIW